MDAQITFTIRFALADIANPPAFLSSLALHLYVNGSFGPLSASLKPGTLNKMAVFSPVNTINEALFWVRLLYTVSVCVSWEKEGSVVFMSSETLDADLQIIYAK